MINNINTYELEMPRKAVKDYYKNVQFQIPVLEKQFGPSDIYKRKYIETFKKQINDKVNLVWDYYSEYASAPDRSGSKIEGINVVSPSFFHLDKNGVE